MQIYSLWNHEQVITDMNDDETATAINPCMQAG